MRWMYIEAALIVLVFAGGYVTISLLRQGHITDDRGRIGATRENNPFIYWMFVSIAATMTIMFAAMALYRVLERR